MLVVARTAQLGAIFAAVTILTLPCRSSRMRSGDVNAHEHVPSNRRA
jgi:hypothetical protein